MTHLQKDSIGIWGNIRIKRWSNRLWTSPTANTWLSLFTRSVSLVLVLPLVLRQFPEGDVAVWFVFSAVLAVQGVLGFGFSPSFARLFSYARAGAAVEDMADLRHGLPIAGAARINLVSIDRLYSSMSQIFLGLTLASLLLLGTLGTAAVWRPITHTGHRPDVWLAWAVVAVGSSMAFWNLTYVTYLQGMDYLVQWRRWETGLSLLSIMTSFVVLLCGGGLLALVIANQIWTIGGLLVFRVLCRQLEPDVFPTLGRQPWESAVFQVVWPSAWKSGVTGIMTIGLIQATGVIHAQFGDARSTATYNLMLRIATVLGQVVQAPFITKVPELARRRAIGDLSGQLAMIRRGMRLVHWSTAAVTLAVGMGMPLGLTLSEIKSAEFAPALWMLFSLNMFFERHGGMLHQIRNLTNQPMEHIGMLGYFGTNVVLMLLFHPSMGMYAYPAAMLGTQLLFALWFNARIAYPVLGVRPLAFERQVSLPPLLAILFINAGMYWFWHSTLTK